MEACYTLGMVSFLVCKILFHFFETRKLRYAKWFRPKRQTVLSFTSTFATPFEENSLEFTRFRYHRNGICYDFVAYGPPTKTTFSYTRHTSERKFCTQQMSFHSHTVLFWFHRSCLTSNNKTYLSISFLYRKGK